METLFGPCHRWGPPAADSRWVTWGDTHWLHWDNYSTVGIPGIPILANGQTRVMMSNV